MDKRKANTRRAILKAFVEQLVESGYDDMTVQDILDRSGVGRATFYAHFGGKEDLLAYQIRAICNHALNPTTPERHHDFVGKDDPLSQTEHVLCHLLERENGVRALLAGNGSERFADCLRHEIVARADTAVPEHPSGPAASMNRAFLLHHIAASFVGMVRWWAWTDFSTSPHDLALDYLWAILPLFGMEPPDAAPQQAETRPSDGLYTATTRG